MKHPYVVIVPLRDRDCKTGFPSAIVNHFDSIGVEVILAVNGPDVLATSFGGLKPTTTVIDAGREHNPYSARNSALKKVFAHDSDVVYAVLMDADCAPEPFYHSELMALLDDEGSKLIAGRTLTRVPKGTLHFDLLHAARFECYDGFTPPDHTVGSNMVIGRKVYERLGPMRETTVSGGDGCYGIDWKKLHGGSVTVASSLKVYKTISGMTLRGVLEKQIRRACCYPPEMVPALDENLTLFNEVLDQMKGCCATPEGFIQNYAHFVDQCFKLGMRLGIFSQLMDRSTDDAEPTDSNEGQPSPT